MDIDLKFFERWSAQFTDLFFVSVKTHAPKNRFYQKNLFAFVKQKVEKVLFKRINDLSAPKSHLLVLPSHLAVSV